LGVVARGWWWRLCSSQGISLAVGLAINFKVAIGKRLAAIEAAETSHMVLSTRLILDELSLDSEPTASTQTAIELVVVLLTVWLVVQNVEFGRGEWF
jgi:hypothetical protein